MNKASLLELAKKLNIPRRNCMETKEELEEAMKDTIKGYKEIIFCKKSSLPSFLPCSSNFSRCSFMICFILALAWFLISALSLQYFSTSCNTL